MYLHVWNAGRFTFTQRVTIGSEGAGRVGQCGVGFESFSQPPGKAKPSNGSRIQGSQDGEERIKVVEFSQFAHDLNHLLHGAIPLTAVAAEEHLRPRPKANAQMV